MGEKSENKNSGPKLATWNYLTILLTVAFERESPVAT